MYCGVLIEFKSIILQQHADLFRSPAHTHSFALIWPFCSMSMHTDCATKSNINAVNKY